MRPFYLIVLCGLMSMAIVSCKSGSESSTFMHPKAGLTKQLAQYRAVSLKNIQYRLHLNIPDSADKPIIGKEYLHYILLDDSKPLVLDFRNAGKLVKSIELNGRKVTYHTKNGHIIISSKELSRGNQFLILNFNAGNEALNRNESYMYSLFVPALASTAFPCFDQPDLKAGFQLHLTVPGDWEAVSNGQLVRVITAKGKRDYYFGQTPPLSTYQFAFSAGKFQVMKADRGGQHFDMYYRESNKQIVERNSKDIFDLEIHALNWLKKYTGIPFPYDKFDFVAVPSFQFGGMEHPGAVYYKASELFLGKSATVNDSLRRANLISHETSHMWFGDMVTMQWFNDVWTKEVYAQFMADKMVQELFPKINFDQRFLLSHYPPAYSKDRSEGAEPVRQPLNNLVNASNMYIMAYDKAPIVMRQLEQIIGKKKFQEGLREYLNTYRFSNATWRDLITILNKYTDQDLRQWNKVWVEQPGRPTITVKTELNNDGTIKDLKISQKDPAGKNRVWPQELNVMLYYGHDNKVIPVYMNKPEVTVSKVNGWRKPDFILPNGKGKAYGLFKLDKQSMEFLTKDLPEIKEPDLRTVAWITLWDNFLEGSIPVQNMMDLTMRALPREDNDLNTQLVLGYVNRIYWQFMTSDKRKDQAPGLENLLWNQMHKVSSSSMKSSYFHTFQSVVITHKGLKELKNVWAKETKIDGLSFSEQDYTGMAAHLAITEYPGWKKILDRQETRIKDPDRKQEFEFVRPALSNKAEVRDSFFNSLKKESNRHHEPWVLRGLRYLNNPLRAPQSETYVLPSLKLLREIQATGDIFFPGRWIDASISGHNNVKAAQTVRTFLKKRPDYPHFLKDKILQAADPLFRAARIIESEKHSQPN
ncbi:MAG TPA: M1 family aminopeptidase [Balneolales bacterium]|nr:M1 family aminopeptidase [Balneolales bacterium]